MESPRKDDEAGGFYASTTDMLDLLGFTVSRELKGKKALTLQEAVDRMRQLCELIDNQE